MTKTNYFVKLSENHANKVTEFVLLFINSIILARFLGPSDYGIYGIFITFITIFSAVLSLGYEQLLNVYVIKNSEEIKRYLCIDLLKRRIKLYLFIIPGLIISAGIIYYFEFISFKVIVFTFIAIPYLLFYSLNIYWQKFFIADLDTRICFKFKLLYLLISIAANYTALLNNFNLEWLLVINVLILLLITLLWYRYFSHKYKISQIDTSGYNINFKFGYESWTYELLELGLSKHLTTIFLIYFNIASNAIGYFNLAINIAVIFQLLLIGGFDGVGLTIFSQISNDRAKLVTAWNTVSKFISLLTLPLIMITILYAKDFILIFYSSEYSSGIKLVQLFLMFFIFMRILGGGIHITVLYALEDSKTALKYKFIIVGAAVILNLTLVSLYGITGAIIAMGTAQTLFLFLMMLITQKKLKARYAFTDQFKLLLISAAPAMLLNIVIDSSTMFHILSVPLYLLFFVILLILFKPFSRHEMELITDKVPSFRKVFSLLYAH